MDLIDLAREAGLNPKRVASTKGGEYHSSCPDCEGKTRFVIQPHFKAKNCEGRYFCRQCDAGGDSIQFCMEYLDKDFRSAVEYLHLSLPEKTLIPDWRGRSTPEVLNPPKESWSTRAEEIVQLGEYYIQKAPAILEMLAKRGLPSEAVKQYRIGYLPEAVFDDRSIWGLPSVLDNESKEKRLWIPKGIVIPSIDGGVVVRIKIRRTDWASGDRFGKYIRLSGGMNGFNIVGNHNKKVMIVVESELDAFALHFSAQDLIVAVSAGSNMANPDNVVDHWARRCSRLLICHDNDEAGLAMMRKWARDYPNATPFPTPVGKDVGEAVLLGFDLCSWIHKNVK